jgi:uncharacterized membrane protein
MINNKGHGPVIPYYILIPLITVCSIEGKIMAAVCFIIAVVYRAIRFTKEPISKSILMSALQGIALYLSLIVLDLIVFYTTGISLIGYLLFRRGY